MATLAESSSPRKPQVSSCGIEHCQQPRRSTPRQEVLFPCRHPHDRSMQNIDDRIASYVGWPNHIRATPRQLAEAGLYSIQIADRTKCFYCNGGLENWDFDDDPWKEHAKFYPECEYLLSRKGVEFVANVRIQNPNPPSPVVHAASYGGVSVINMRNTTIRVNGGNIRSTSSSPTPSGPIFYQTILPGGNFVQESIPGQAFTAMGQRPVSPPRASAPARSLEERTNEAMRSELARMMINFGYSEELVKRTIRKKFEESPSTETFQSASEFVEAIEAVRRESENGAQSHIGENSVQVPEAQRQDQQTELQEAAATRNEESSAQDRIQELMREKRCKICLDQDSSCIFEPCGHMCACLGCGTRLRECPICRRRISTIRRVYTA